MFRNRRWMWLGFLFGCTLFFFGFGAAGMGHGTFLPLAIYGAPLSAVPFLGMIIAPPWWTAVGWTISYQRRGAAATMVGAHLLAVGLFLWFGTPMEHGEDQWTYFTRAERSLPVWIWGGLTIYSVGLLLALKAVIAATPIRPAAHPSS